jgi:hypothetical protein
LEENENLSKEMSVGTLGWKQLLASPLYCIVFFEKVVQERYL